MAKGQTNRETKLEVPQGTLDLMVLQTLDSMAAQRGYAGKRQLAREVETWDRLASLIDRLRGAEEA